MNQPGTIWPDLPGDVLEAVVTTLPTIDLLSASCVSHDWLHAVRSSLHTRPRLFPWLILRCLPHCTASTHSIHALDPYSRTWLSVPRRNNSIGKQSLLTPYFLHGSTRDLLYTLTLSQLVISKDPFGSSIKMEMKGPKIWRQDPVVAEVGHWVVVVGGGFITDLDEGEEEGAVEIYNKQTGTWELAEPMPTNFEGSYATLLSVAVSDNRLYVIEKDTGWVSQFDPESKTWEHTCQLRPDSSGLKWSIGIASKERLLLVGAGREGEVMKVRIWEIDGDTLQVINNNPEEMPTEMVDRLFPDFNCLNEDWQVVCSVEVRGTERGGYMFDPENIKNGTVMYQLSMEEEKEGRRVWRWEWVPSPATVGCGMMERISVGCSPVTLHEVARCLL
ncbi:F-box/kelch-repeat protein At1g23390-like [Carex rostrata]